MNAITKQNKSNGKTECRAYLLFQIQIKSANVFKLNKQNFIKRKTIQLHTGHITL